jgi:hypothetical protein
MTHVSCPNCRLRFKPALAVHLSECPACGDLLEVVDRAEPMLGLRLFDANLRESQEPPPDIPSLTPAVSWPLPEDRR